MDPKSASEYDEDGGGGERRGLGAGVMLQIEKRGTSQVAIKDIMEEHTADLEEWTWVQGLLEIKDTHRPRTLR